MGVYELETKKKCALNTAITKCKFGCVLYLYIDKEYLI